jgi:N utilization substance protein B
MADEVARERRTDTNDPRASRGRALMILFQADVRGEDPLSVLDRVVANPREWDVLDAVDDREVLGTRPVRAEGLERDTDAPVPPPVRTSTDLDVFARSLVAGVVADLPTIDALVARFAHDWRLSRMPALDRTILRLATYELLHESTPRAVVLDEAVEAAKSLSTDSSARYVNGVLNAVADAIDVARAAVASGDGPGPATSPVMDDEPVPSTTGEVASPE